MSLVTFITYLILLFFDLVGLTILIDYCITSNTIFCMYNIFTPFASYLSLDFFPGATWCSMSKKIVLEGMEHVYVLLYCEMRHKWWICYN